jgi:hypothetical protein
MKTTALTSLQELEVLPHLTIPTNLVDRRTKYYSQHSLLVRTHQSFYLCTNTRFGHLRNNSSTFTKRLNFLWFLNLLFFIVFLYYYYYYYCIINFTITIPLFLFLPSLLSLLLHYNPLFSLPSTLSAPSHSLFPPYPPPPPILPQPVITLWLSPTYSPPTD